jgi:serine/threonine-protein kinase
MPYVEGESARGLRRETRLPVHEALRIAGQVADDLAYAHEQGVVHRDVKPENILLSGGPASTHGRMGHSQALVADFGIARAASLASGDQLTGTGLALGTAHYMSPEQVAGERTLDGRADVYALGCVLYEMLAGEPPFTGPTAQAIAARTMAELTPLVRRSARGTRRRSRRHRAALAKALADRFATATEFGDALAQAAAVPAPALGGALVGGAALAIVVLAVAGIGLFGATAGRATSSRPLPHRRPALHAQYHRYGAARLGRDLAFTRARSWTDWGASGWWTPTPYWRA